MIVDDLRTRERADEVERSGRVRWHGGDFRLSVSTASRFSPPPDDATGFLCAALVRAMRLGEDLELRGGVSRRLLVVIETNLRELTDPIVADWADMVGDGLAFLAHAMAGGLGHVVIPSSAAPTRPDGELRTDSPAFVARAERDAMRALASQPRSSEAGP